MGNKLTPSGGNDKVMTPYPLARRIVDFLQPRGNILEPCAGEGAFVQAITEHLMTHGAWPQSNVDYCEIDEGMDFYDFDGHADWIITNPPFSLLSMLREKQGVKSILRHAFEHADNVAFLFTTNHGLSLRARRELARECGFGVNTVIEIDRPREFPPSGFQWGIVVWKRGYVGPQYWHDWTTAKEAVEDAV